jgi:hypothetical protein
VRGAAQPWRPDRLGREARRRFHRGQGEERQPVILHDVAQRPDSVVPSAALLDTERLGRGDLDVVDELLIPERLPKGIAKPEGQDVLHRLIAQVVVDSRELVLANHGPQTGDELSG